MPIVTLANCWVAQPVLAAAVPGSNCNLFPADNVWNTDISQLPVNTHSAAWLASSGAASGRLLHPDFGGPPYGMPYNVVDNSHPTSNPVFDYGDESDPGPYPTGPDIQIEGTPGDGGDDHGLIVNKDTCKLYEIYNDGRGDGTAGSGAIWNLNSNALRPAGWTSADAAGLPILPGLVRYDEVQAGAIKHAIRFTVQRTDTSYLWPARHQAGSASDPNLPPMGARFRLKSSYDISRASPQAQIILTAMQHYGMILADNGSNWYFQGTEDSRWSDSLLSELKGIPANQFEAVDESSLMVNPNSGQAAQPCGPNPPAASPSAPSSPTDFYFAEGFTGAGFEECLSLFMPATTGTAAIDYFTESGHLATQYVSLSAGQVARVDVAAAVGAGHQVSAQVALPGPGIAERKLSFDFGQWHGSTDLVGTSAPASQWDFAEGSTLSIFSQYLTLQNSNPSPVTVDLHYQTDMGAHPTKTTVLAPSSRTTIEVFKGDLNDNPNCSPSLGTCGIGPGVQGDS
ncbi:MAG TPA: hypothetical protein VG015_07335, partial [Candidatus Dormibacteraeota bacterium]|nr:hypothetical protein [Candidatus Dormibacteraeota bacterium]